MELNTIEIMTHKGMMPKKIKNNKNPSTYAKYLAAPDSLPKEVERSSVNLN